MAAIPTNTLLAEVNCYSCLGLSLYQILNLSLLRRQLIALNPSADTSVNGLMSYGACFACLGISQYELMELSLLDQIAQLS